MWGPLTGHYFFWFLVVYRVLFGELRDTVAGNGRIKHERAVHYSEIKFLFNILNFICIWLYLVDFSLLKRRIAYFLFKVFSPVIFYVNMWFF